MTRMKYGFIAAMLLLLLGACKKEEGEGGMSSIRGRVDIIYRAVLTNPTPADTSGAFDQEVYINYGDVIGPSDRIRTNYKGEFEFPNLRPGKYTVYVYSKDTLPVSIIDPKKIAVVREVKIEKRKETVDIPVIYIYDKNN